MTDIQARLAAALADRYRIERELGAGGMATVYLAEDLKHKRNVALKVLKPELAAVLGAERFVQEITTTASMSHPHILPLFDSGEADGFLFYVMPFVDGETLRDRLNRETQLGVDEAVRITREVADALHYAHQRGVIHRDIKPENILLQGGRPLVADFGIALAVSAAAGGRMTETGLSLGTPHYMSPEQATAEKEITGRSDVYSLASVCYEMLTGNPPHVGSSAQQIIMKIITEQPQAVTTHRKAVPPYVAAAISKALEKLPADRFETAEKFAEALGNPSFTTMTSAGSAAHAGRRGTRPAVLAAAIAATALTTAAATWLAKPAAPPPPLVRYRMALPDSQMPASGFTVPLPSADGSFIVYLGPLPGERSGTQLWMKRRDALEATPIPGTRDVGFFAISPDGKRLAFDYGGTLRTLPITGGTPLTLVDPNVASLGLAWLDDETIIYTGAPPENSAAIDLFVIAASGGTPRRLGLQEGVRVAVIPSVVQGHEAVLYLSCVSPLECDLHVADLRDSTSKMLVPGSRTGVFAASGHLLFERGGSVFATRFDPDRLEMLGDAVVFSDQLASEIFGAPFAVSPDGTMTQMIGGPGISGLEQELVWVDRRGRMEPVDPDMAHVRMTASGLNQGWSLSPDGTKLAIGLNSGTGDDIWVKQLPRGALTRITFNPNASYRPRWTPDGRSIAYITTTDARLRRADGTGQDSIIIPSQLNELQYSPDGKWLLVRLGAAGPVVGGRDIHAMQIGVDTAPRPLLASPNFDETAIAMSPDSRWLLYQSNESGRNELYVRSFPDVDRLRVQVSVSGGETPLWSRDGREIFFVSRDRQMMSVKFAPGVTPSVSTPESLFAMPAALFGVETTFMTPWAMGPDGRFLMSRTVEVAASERPTLVVTHNLFTELNARLPR